MPSIRAALLALAILIPGSAAAQLLPAQQGAETPAAKPTGGGAAGAPAPTVSLDGAWRYDATCVNGKAYNGRLVFAGTGGSFHGDVSGIDGTILNVSVEGTKVTFNMDYQLLGKQRDFWSGTLAGSGNAMSGNLTDPWDGECAFTARRQ